MALSYRALAVLTSLCLLPAAAQAQTKTFTTNADFDGGSKANVCHGPAAFNDCADPTPDQLVLGRTPVSKVNRVWADNYRVGWIVGIDATTGRQFARFDAAVTQINGINTGAFVSQRDDPAGYCNWGQNIRGNCPGRVTTDTNGNVWIINRAFNTQGSISKFSGTIDNCVDRNGNGVIDTSTDANGDGIVDPDNPAEYFGQNDECILATIALGGQSFLPRGVAVDKKGRVWASTHDNAHVYRFNGDEPVSLEVDLNLANIPEAGGCHPYSMATGKDYVFLSCSNGPNVRIHIDTLEVKSAPCLGTYGIVADPEGRWAYVGGYFHQGTVLRADYTTDPPTCPQIVNEGQTVTALSLDYDLNIWAAAYNEGIVRKIAPDGTVLGTAPIGANPHGVSLDFNGRIWVIMHQSPFIRAVNTDLTPADFGGFTPTLTAPPGQWDYDPYLYSDFTGTQIDRQAPYTRAGSYDVTYDSNIKAMPWRRVAWNTEPEGLNQAPDTKLTVSARAGDTPQALGQAAYEPVQNGVDFSGVAGRYVQVKVDFAGPGYETPILSDLSVTGPCDTIGETCCLRDTDCVAPDACSIGKCPAPGGTCTYTKKVDCCLSDDDCNDNNVCTVDACPGPGQQCTHSNQDGCCNSNQDCDDGKPCTADICSGPGGTCQNKDINGCCVTDTDCDKGNACIAFKCPAEGAICELTPVKDCCNSDADCADTDACTVDKCNLTTHECALPEKQADCCSTDKECDDGNPCTTDLCPVAGGKCQHKEVAECCLPTSEGVGKPCDEPESPNNKKPCQAGKQVCKNNKYVCEGAKGPQTEVCDNLDNDCDGVTDNGANLCAAGTACVKGQCVSPCKGGEFPCPAGYQCEEGLCQPTECATTKCPAGYVCKAAGECIPDPAGAGGSGAGGSGAGGSSAGGASAGGKGGATGSGASSSGTGGASAGGATGSTGGATSGNAGGSASGTAGSTSGSTGGMSASGGSSTAGAAAPAGDSASEDKGGCGCEVPGGGRTQGGAAVAALALGAIVARRRRRAS